MEGCYDEREPRLNIRPAPVHDLLEVAHDGQHGDTVSTSMRSSHAPRGHSVRLAGSSSVAWNRRAPLAGATMGGASTRSPVPLTHGLAAPHLFDLRRQWLPQCPPASLSAPVFMEGGTAPLHGR
jgi:hypothetical protein